ncbi:MULTISPECIES: SigE family RNA polymerase sigma factor [Nocardioides]|uniref:SigE family RNA polymerase sigma factor n=1 Tax=Nocardioides TaxID=1839 RepID=UPI00032F8F35|nr:MULTISPECIES: SigE family RNA polymerase sigma factor [Nocardioides]EON24665.1 sigma-70, region 4 type 2 [Nocardioides sp. CF8]
MTRNIDDSFVEFVAAHRARLFRTAYLLVGDAHRAEDIVQTALTKLYVAWSRVASVDNVEAYARRAVINAHLSEHRRPWRRERLVLDDIEPPAVHDPDPGEGDALWTALRGLPIGQRRIVLLRHYWGLSVAETAADLGIGEGTVKRQTWTALNSLRSVLGTTELNGGHR